MSWPVQQQQGGWGKPQQQGWPVQQQQQQWPQQQQQQPQQMMAGVPPPAGAWPQQQQQRPMAATGGWGVQTPPVPQQGGWGAAMQQQQQQYPAAAAGAWPVQQQQQPAAGGWGQPQPQQSAWAAAAQPKPASGWGQIVQQQPIAQAPQAAPAAGGWGVPQQQQGGWGAAIQQQQQTPSPAGVPPVASSGGWGIPQQAAAGAPATPPPPLPPQEGMTPTKPAPTTPTDPSNDTKAAALEMDDKHWADAKAWMDRVLNPATGGDPSFGPAVLTTRELRFSAPGLFAPDPKDQLRQSVMTLGPLAKKKTEQWFATEVLNKLDSSSSADKVSGTLVLCAAVWKNLSTDPASLSQAAELYSRAAEMGNARAMCYLGFCHQNGIGVARKDDGAALKWYKKGADNGDVMAQQLHSSMQAAQAQAQQAAEMAEAQKAQQAILQAQQSALLAQQYAQQDMATARVFAQALGQMDAKQWQMAKMTLDRVAGDKPLAPIQIIIREIWFCAPKTTATSADQTESLRRAVEGTPIELRGRCWNIIEMLMQVQPKPSPFAYLIAAMWKFFVEEDNAERLRYLNIASGLGLSRAHFYLAEAHFAGNGVPRDSESAMTLLQEAAGNGDAMAQLMVGIRTNNPAMLKAAAAQGIPDGLVSAYRDREFMLEIEAEHMTRYALYAMDRNDRDAARQLVDDAYSLDQNFGPLMLLRREMRLAVPSFYPGPDRTLNEQAKCGAMSLGQKSRVVKFLEIMGTFKSQSSWVTLIRALWLHSLPPMPQFPQVQLFQTCAEKMGNARAQCYLGLYYLNGNCGLPRDPTEAVRLFKLAVAQNDATAQYQLGLCCLNGVGTKQDEVEGARLLRLAADQQDCEAQCELGLCLEKARGVAEDWPQAKQWIALSVTNECTRAPAEYDIIVELMRNREQEVLLRNAIAALDAGVTPASLETAKTLLETSLNLFNGYFPARILLNEIRSALPRLFAAGSAPVPVIGSMTFMQRTWTYVSGLLSASPESPFTLLLCGLWQQFIYNDAGEFLKLLTSASNHGNLRAKCHLAIHYAMQSQLTEAAVLLAQASDGDDSYSHLLYGDALSHAKGLAQDNLAEARKRFNQAHANGYAKEAEVRLRYLTTEEIVKSAIIAFDNKDLALSRAKTQEALRTADGFGPALILQVLLNQCEPKTQDYSKALGMQRILANCNTEWDHVFVDEVLADLRTTKPIGLVIAAFWRLYSESNKGSAMLLLKQASEKGCARGQVTLAEQLLESKKRADALPYLRMAAAQADLLGQFKLAMTLLDGPTPAEATEAFQTLLAASVSGYHPIQLQLGFLFAKGIGTAQNWVEAAKLFRLAAVQENPEAQAELARCLMHALGVAENWPEAHEWFARSINNGFKSATGDMGILEEWMRNREQENLVLKAVKAAGDKKFNDAKQLIDECLHLFEIYVPALLLKQEVRAALPRLFSDDTDVRLEPKIKEAIKALSQEHRQRAATFVATRLADPKLAMPAGSLLGACWKKQVDNSTEGALELFKVAAYSGNNARALCYVGEYYAKGWSVDVDKVVALDCYKKAAAQEDATGIFVLSTLQNSSPLEVVKLLRQSALFGFKDAQYELANHFRDGKGIAQSLEEAIKLFISAAEQGHTLAQYEAGTALLNGVACKKDEVKGAHYLSFAAEKGMPEACYRYGLCLLNGVGVSSSERKAAAMFSTASAGGIEPAAKELNRLQAKWREEELQEAQEETMRAQIRSARAVEDAAHSQKAAADAQRRYFR